MSKIIDLRKIKKEEIEKQEIKKLAPRLAGSPLAVGFAPKTGDANITNEANNKLPVTNDQLLMTSDKPNEVESTDKIAKVGFWSKVLDFSLELIKVVVISLAIVIPIRYFLIQPFYVKGASMEPSFYDHEYLIINEIVYRIDDPGRGDIVVFKYPRQPSQYFIKRIIGLPKERIQVKDGVVTIFNRKHPEGKVLDESLYLSEEVATSGDLDLTLKSNEYFVLGDNRNSSLDSRTFGAVPRANIIGKTWFRGWPFNRATKFEAPKYNL